MQVFKPPIIQMTARMSTFKKIQLIAALFAAAAWLAVDRLSAQSANQAISDRAAPTAKSVVAAPSDAAARAKIAASDAWKQVEMEYQKWLSHQTIYTPSQIKRINDQLSHQFDTMPISELQGYLDDWQAKLKVLNGKDFQEAQNWLGAYISNMAQGYRRNYLHSMGLTDIPNMSAAQLETAITNIRADRMSIIQKQAAFESNQQQMVQTVQQDIAASQKAQQQFNSNVGAGFNTFQSPYRPPKYDPPPNPQMQWIMGSDGQLMPW
jgi:hypothetical protein